MRINGQNYNMPSGKLHGLQREMIFSHYSDKHVIVEQIYESGKKVLHCNVFSNGLRVSFRNESLPKKISFMRPDYLEIGRKVENLLYKDKVLQLLGESGAESVEEMEKSGTVVSGEGKISVKISSKLIKIFLLSRKIPT